MKTNRTAPPTFYIPPTPKEMKKMAKKFNLYKFPDDLIEDFCNLTAGGEILPPSQYRKETLRAVVGEIGLPDKKGNYLLSSGNSTKSRAKAIKEKLDAKMKYEQKICDFLRTIEMEKIPGQTPLAKSMNLLKLMAKKGGGEESCCYAEDANEIPIFVNCQNPEGLASEINDLLDTIDSLDESEKKLLDIDPEMEIKDDRDLKKMKLAEDMDAMKEIWIIISRKLDKLVRMRVTRSLKVTPDPAGDETRNRPIAHFDEMNKLNKREWALPRLYRLYRIASHTATVRERAIRTDKQQLLYMIIDCSGSMENGDRIAKAGGVLFNRLKAVVSGDAQIYIRYFDSELYEEHFAATAEEAKILLEHFREKNFSGGDTKISACAREAQKRIEEIVSENELTRPELVIVTDGDDRINLSKDDFPGTKMHAFVVGGENSRLTDVAIDTGGVGINNL
jgi:Mg-chelatase subunit ChlD